MRWSPSTPALAAEVERIRTGGWRTTLHLDAADHAQTFYVSKAEPRIAARRVDLRPGRRAKPETARIAGLRYAVEGWEGEAFDNLADAVAALPAPAERTVPLARRDQVRGGGL